MLEVDRGVLVPRPETELLVDWACEVAALTSSGRAAIAARSAPSTSAPAAAPSRWR